MSVIFKWLNKVAKYRLFWTLWFACINNLVCILIGVRSRSPHTSVFSCNFSWWWWGWSVVRRFISRDTLLTRNIVHTEYTCADEILKRTWSSELLGWAWASPTLVNKKKNRLYMCVCVLYVRIAYRPYMYRRYPRDHFVLRHSLPDGKNTEISISCRVYGCKQTGMKGGSVRFFWFSDAPNLMRL